MPMNNRETISDSIGSTELSEQAMARIRSEEEYRRIVRAELAESEKEMASRFTSPLWEKLIFPMIVVAFAGALTKILVPAFVGLLHEQQQASKVRLQLLEELMHSATSIENAFTTYHHETISYWQIMNHNHLEFLKTVIGKEDGSLDAVDVQERRAGLDADAERISEKYFTAIDRINRSVDEFHLWSRVFAIKARFHYGKDEQIANLSRGLENTISMNSQRIESSIETYRDVNLERGKRFRNEVLPLKAEARRDKLIQIFRETQATLPTDSETTPEFLQFYSFVEGYSHLISNGNL